MVNRTILLQLRKKFKVDEITIEKAFVDAYIRTKEIEIEPSRYLKNYLMFSNTETLSSIGEFLNQSGYVQDMDDLITAFELLLDHQDKKNKGMVYTPSLIKEHILEKVIVQEQPPLIMDPACGCGSFLVSAARRLKQQYHLSYQEIFSTYLYGADVDEHSIEKSMVLFHLLALEAGEEPLFNKSHFIIGNSLELLCHKRYLGKFDVVIGNPPYVRARNIEEAIKDSLKNWSVVNGNVDLYIPFYQLGIGLLNQKGKLGFISPNTFLQSVNGRKLRTFLVKLEREIRILDFRENQAFSDITHYTCVCIIDKEKKCRRILYALLNRGSSLLQYDYTEYHMDSYQENAEWRFGSSRIDEVIKQIEKQPQHLEDYRIRNGLATLKNDLYFFTTLWEDETYYYREYQGQEYAIEKKLCIPVAKPNILRNEEDLKHKLENAIFPYKKTGDKMEILQEAQLQQCYPKAYAFLTENKEELLKRDKGKASRYAAWYAYGRTQGMNNQGKKLLIPYMAERGVAVLAQEEELLFYCGYAVFSEDTQMLCILKKLIESKVFWYYISNTSKPYSKGYMALAKNYIRNFGVPDLQQEQKEELLQMQQGEECESYIARLYGLTLEQL